MNYTLFYTHNLRGDLDRLPSLYTWLKTLRAEFSGPDQPQISVDLGDHCAAEVWHCAATEGRSPLIVLDAMGYTAARTGISAASRARLGDMLRLTAVDADHPHAADGYACTLGAAHPSAPLTIALTPAPELHLAGGVLHLPPLQAVQVGRVSVRVDSIDHHIYPVPAATPPDPTIAAVVDFVYSEARLYQRKRTADAHDNGAQ
jgi:hypothetical protein